jgi:hypothetical protein
MRTGRRVRLALGTVVAIAALGLIGPLTACEPTCPTVDWGSGAKTQAGGGTLAPVVTSRVGQQSCFDRFVIELAGPPAGYDVRYVSSVSQEGSGEPVALAGGAKLQVVVRAPAYNLSGTTTYQPADPNHVHDVTGFSAFRQIVYLGSFEGVTSWGVGVRARLPMQVTVLPGPGSHARVVIDVAHNW